MSSMRILIIEDDRDAAAYLTKAFREVGHIADHAADGLNGYDLAREGAYDVAVVDRMLPKMDGLSLDRRLARPRRSKSTPVLILSAARRRRSARARACAPAATTTLTKPFAFTELLGLDRSPAAPRRPPGGRETRLHGGDLSRWTCSPTPCGAAAARSICSHANSACSNS